MKMRRVNLGAFAKLRKATFKFMSARMQKLGSHWTNCHEIW